MRTLFCVLAVGAMSLSSAHAATIDIVNGDFEDTSYALTRYASGSQIYHDVGAAGFDNISDAGTYSPLADGVLVNVPLGSRVGYVNSGATLYQNTGVIIDANTSYEFSALFGNRIDAPTFGGVFGLFAGGDPNNVIGEQVLTSPNAIGVLELQSLFLDSPAFANYVGQTLGIFVKGVTSQVTFDNLSLISEDTLVNPLPGAVWLFGTALVGGGGMLRRRKLKKA